MRTLVLLACFFLGCANYRPRFHTFSGAQSASAPATQENCTSLNKNVRFWGANAAFSMAITGSNGIGVAAADLKDNNAAKLSLGITIAVFAAWGAVSAWLYQDYAKSRERSCEEVK